VLAEARFERPLVSLDSQAALAALRATWQRTAAQRRVWVAGSYAETGVPLLESAVRSALSVAAALGVASPLSSA
jgi:predicted NAD/FAD-binding protein